MKTRRIAIILSAAFSVAFHANPASAQLPGGIGGAANAAQAQAQQRLQAQAQQRARAEAQQRAQAQLQQRAQAQVQHQVQAQVQQQVQAQAQQRLQAEAARAARIAQQAAAIAERRAAAARQHAAGGINVRLGANAHLRNETHVANQSAEANAHARLGIQAGLILPPGVTQSDVKIYDNIFGRFNPLRPQADPHETSPPARQQSDGNSPPDRDTASQDAPRRPERDPSFAAWNEFDLASRIEIAARQRRAEISEIRDRALVTTNEKLLFDAEAMEAAINAFVEAHARAHAEAEAEAGHPRSATRPDVRSQNNGTVDANGASGVRR